MEIDDVSSGSGYWTLSRVAAAAVMVLAIAGLGLLLVHLSGFLMLVFAAIVLAVVFDAITRVICAWLPIGRAFSLALAVVILLGTFIGALLLFGAQLAGEFDTIRNSLPGAVDKLQAFVQQLGLGDAAQSIMESARRTLSTGASRIGTYMLAFGNGLTNLILVIFAAVFLAADPGVYRRGFLHLIPEKGVKSVQDGLSDVGHGLNGWMKGQVISSIVVAALTSVGLGLLGVPSAAGLGVIAGLLDVVPMIGPVISGVPAVLLAFTQSPATALWTVVLFLVVQQLQGNFLQPMIQKQAVDVPPAVLLFTVVAAGSLFGFLGVLLAAPLTIAVFVLVKRIYVKNLLGKDVKVQEQE